MIDQSFKISTQVVKTMAVMSTRNLASLLTWRPAHLSATKHVDVKVKDRLSSILPVVDHKTVTISCQALLFSYLLGHEHQMTKQL